MMRWNGDNDGGNARKPGNRLAVVLVWRSPLVRAALAALLDRMGYAVTAEAGEWPAEPVAALAIVEIDLLPGVLPSIPVIAIAPTADHPKIASAAANVAGLVLGSESTDCLRLCLAAVAGGGRWLDNAAIGDAIERAEAAKDAALLTRRERDVARLVATGQRNRAIAGSLGISEGTVKMHLHNVYAKLGLESRTQLAMDERMRMRG